MRRASSLLFALSLMLGACGCADKKFGLPKFFAPGPTQFQQQQAQKFDPYAEYGPALGESRPPRGAGDQPLPEASRNRWELWGAPRYGFQ